MERTVRGAWLVLTLILAALPAASQAQDVCKADAARFCDGRPPAELLSCLQAHRADLAGPCQDYVEWAMVAIESLLQDCQPDAFQLCRNVGRGEPTVTCLSRNQGKLTRRCQEDFDAFARAEAASAKACADDVARACGDVAPGKGDVFLCLVYRTKSLSPACRKALAR